MSRVVLLPTPGEPYRLSYWLRNYATWAHVVDRLVVVVNRVEESVTPRLCELAEAAGARLIAADSLSEHGQMLTVLLEACVETHVMLAEDDAYVRRLGEVEGAFRRVESGDFGVLGSPRGSASVALDEACLERWPHPRTPALDRGGGLWPCFLFARRETLAGVRGTLGACTWQPGERVAGLELDAPELWSSDTFGAAAYQLRARHRVGHVCQHHQPVLWPDPPWFHVGSLSSGPFTGMESADLLRSTPSEEWARRLWWWTRFVDTDPWDGGYRARYVRALEELRKRTCGRGQIEMAGADSLPLLTWEGA